MIIIQKLFISCFVIIYELFFIWYEIKWLVPTTSVFLFQSHLILRLIIIIFPAIFVQTETMRRCRFFFNVFGLELPDYLSCNQFTDSNNPDICVGQKQMREAYNRALKPGKFKEFFAASSYDAFNIQGVSISKALTRDKCKVQLWNVMSQHNIQYISAIFGVLTLHFEMETPIGWKSLVNIKSFFILHSTKFTRKTNELCMEFRGRKYRIL